jgi:hypothetical protein
MTEPRLCTPWKRATSGPRVVLPFLDLPVPSK